MMSLWFYITTLILFIYLFGIKEIFYAYFRIFIIFIYKI